MSESREKIVYLATHGGDNPEKATMPFVLATAAQAMDVDAVIGLQFDGVFLAKKGYADSVHAGGFPPLKELLDTFLKEGGTLYVCSPCLKERQIAEGDLIEGAEIAAAATLTDEILSAKATLVY
ncbi:MAG: DsrE family protein [Thermoanaerobacteraceae bacterium]|nr:DsrE family protein [Thermoanaerobacteraceae bacterium]